MKHVHADQAKGANETALLIAKRLVHRPNSCKFVLEAYKQRLLKQHVQMTAFYSFPCYTLC